MADRLCAQCGKSFSAKRSTARYCSSSCRARASQGVASLTVAPAASPSGSPLVEVTRATLSDAGVLDTVSGQSALLLAERLGGGTETGAAMAALSKQLEALVAAALASVSRADQMDEVTQRRDAKLRAAGRA